MARSGLAELETEEGKTLTATLPASLAAFSGIPVHVITANDYLVERDAEAMSPHVRTSRHPGRGRRRNAARSYEARRDAYACDVTYATNKQISFDYLRDLIAGGGDTRLARRLGARRRTCVLPRRSPPVMRGLCFAIVDEADSVLIDDARTPLILSGEGTAADEGSVRKSADAMAGPARRGNPLHGRSVFAAISS